MEAEIIHNEKWIRLVKYGNYYKVQVKHWFRWKDVTFGPYCPNKVGFTLFTFKHIAVEGFNDCLKYGKSYALQGV